MANNFFIPPTRPSPSCQPFQIVPANKFCIPFRPLAVEDHQQNHPSLPLEGITKRQSNIIQAGGKDKERSQSPPIRLRTQHNRRKPRVLFTQEQVSQGQLS
jgi:hypothetical protein